MLIAHFIDVGQGNMVLLQLDNGHTMLYDCNFTDENADRVIGYLGAVLPRRGIDVFVNSHREADHMRGIRRVHAEFPISTIWDSGVTGGDTTSAEYQEYMALRLAVPRCVTVERRRYHDYFGATRVRVMNAKNDDLADDPNAQSIVIKIENRPGGRLANSLMLTGDSDWRTWEESIIPFYGSEVASTILMGSHHGADDFVWDAQGTRLHADHLVMIRPRVTIVSVGDNGYGHPTPLALLCYNVWSTGAGWVVGGPPNLKVFRTDLLGTMRLQFNNDGSWVINWRIPRPTPPLPIQAPRRLPGRPSLLTGATLPLSVPSRFPARGRTLLTDSIHSLGSQTCRTPRLSR